MKHIDYTHLVDKISDMVIEANKMLAPDAARALRQARDSEESDLARGILDCCLDNLSIAERESLPVCQDTGTAVFFVKMGVEVVLAGGRSPLVQDAIADGVEKGYREGYLRKSILSDPLFDRKNTGTNLPPIIHFEQCMGDLLEIHCAPKGGGAENMSRLLMLSPSAGISGVREFVVRSVLEAGGNPCPPIILGVGIGGNFETAPLLAKKALLREVGSSNADQRYAALENELLQEINRSGIGAQGLGGTVTAMAVHIEWAPCHLASLPVAVNFNCHVHRHRSIVL